MRSEDVLRELSHPVAEDLLRSGVLARLAYTGLDGYPRVIPVGFYWNGEQIVICTAPTSPKVRALTSRPHVALTIDTDSQPAKALLVRGIASIEVVDGVPPEYLAAAAKSMAGADRAAFETQVRAVYKQMARISVEPQWARAYDFGAGRLPAFLRKLVGESHG